MTHYKKYVSSLQSRCRDIPNKDLQNMANDVDPYIGTLLFYSFKNQASFEVVEKHEAMQGKVVPVSRRSFYRKRKQYIYDIEQRLADAGRA